MIPESQDPLLKAGNIFPDDKSQLARRCSNQFCPCEYQSSSKRSQSELCRRCRQRYDIHSYCVYCQQIYFDSTDDGKMWIQCDECAQWVHADCAQVEPSSFNQSLKFSCIKCRKVEPGPCQRKVQTGSKLADRARKATIESPLSNIGFNWNLSLSELTEDLEKIKQYLNRQFNNKGFTT